MVSSCWAPGCANRLSKEKGIKMYRFPTSDIERRNKWIVRVGRMPPKGMKGERRDGLLEPKDHDRLCNAHFITGKPSNNPLDVDYLPSIFMHTPLSKKTPKILQEQKDRQNRVSGRELKKTKSSVALALLSLGQDLENQVLGVACQHSPETRECGTQTDTSFSVCSELENLTNAQCEMIESQREVINTLFNMNSVLQTQMDMFKLALTKLDSKIQTLTEENEKLKVRANLCFGVNFIECNDSVTAYYTGLPNYATFETVFKHSVVHIKRKNTKLSLKNELFLTLVKLKHNIGNEDLAYKFGVSKTLVNTIFHIWLDALYAALAGLIAWPTAEKELQLPEVFRNESFKKVRCIIDCTEIFIERPSALKARAQTYSNYKRHNTIKTLIGISPSGAVTFLSDIWGGRASDRKITMDSGILDRFVPGDVVLADRGFTMKDEFAQRGVKLIVPAFTKGKRQLSAKEVEESRQMSRARIHVERVIGRLKNFKIIGGTMPISFVKGKHTCKKVLSVVGAIVNINQPLL